MSGGTKFDQNKAPLSLLPLDPLEQIAHVMAFGATKYGMKNWQKGISYSRLISAALRHLHQFNEGEDTDSESSKSHIAHAATNLLFLLWMEKHKKDMDDRNV